MAQAPTPTKHEPAKHEPAKHNPAIVEGSRREPAKVVGEPGSLIMPLAEPAPSDTSVQNPDPPVKTIADEQRERSAYYEANVGKKVEDESAHAAKK